MQTAMKLSALALMLLAACGETARVAAPQEPGADTVCTLDGMVLADFPGPKAQIQYVQGNPDFYCDLTELFAVLQAPENKRARAALFVQDMGKADWDHPHGHWIAAEAALYVVGSRKPGSMGPTFGAFSNAQDAAAFARREGGKVLPFAQMTTAMITTRGAPGDARQSH